jgi:hypothetical protein
MSDNTVTIAIPERLYRRLQVVADTTNRPISDILVESAEAMLPVAEADADLPPELADELAAMRLFSDEALWKAVEPTLSLAQQERLTELTQQQQDRGTLTAIERDELEALLGEYDRSVLRRAQALALLSLRGHPLPDLNETDVL